MKFKKLLHFAGAALFAATLFGCASDDSESKGSASPATIDSNNAEAFLLAFTSGVQQADPVATANTQSNAGDSVVNIASGFVGGSSQAPASSVGTFTTHATIEAEIVSSFESISCDPLNAAGSVTATVDFTTTNYSMTIGFHDYCLGDAVDQAILNGQIVAAGTLNAAGEPTSGTVSLVDFSISVNGMTETLNCSISVDGTGNVVSDTCSGSESGSTTTIDVSDGTPGGSATVDDVTVTDHGDGSFSIDGIISTDMGYVQVSTQTPLVLCPANQGGLMAGVVTITGSDNTSATATFNNDCQTMSLCVTDTSGVEQCKDINYMATDVIQ